MTTIAAGLASGILPACHEPMLAETVGAVQFAMPDWPQKARLDDAAAGYEERRDGRGSKVRLSWDIDPRPLPVSELDLPGAAQTSVAGHPALLRGGVATWRCDKTRRLFRLETAGTRAPETAQLAAQVRCHAERMLTNGDVPAASVSSLGPEWHFANRGRGSISYTRGDSVLTFFAGQQQPPPPDAKRAAAGWVAAAGLANGRAEDAAAAAGPQGHPATLVHGTATLDSRPVRWSLLFWRCLQRQKSFAAIVFAEKAPDDEALLSARCHG